MGRYCAAKYIHQDSDAEPSSFLEAKAMLAARHANVVEIFQAELIAGVAVIRMEYLPNGSVEDRYGGQPVPVADAIHIAGDAARGLTYLHSVGLLHRDVKAGNLLIGHSNEIKVADFGLSGSVQEPLRLPAFGYHLTWPPEDISRIPFTSVQGDVYALGVTAYRLLNGDQVFFAKMPDLESLSEAIRKGDFPNRRAWLPHVHSALRKAVTKAMAADPSKRFATTAEFRRALEKAIPAVSWSVTVADGEMKWAGVGRQLAWSSAIQPLGDSSYEFWIASRNASGQLRSRRMDGLIGSLEAVNARATEVLARVALTGQ